MKMKKKKKEVYSLKAVLYLWKLIGNVLFNY